MRSLKFSLFSWKQWKVMKSLTFYTILMILMKINENWGKPWFSQKSMENNETKEIIWFRCVVFENYDFRNSPWTFLHFRSSGSLNYRKIRRPSKCQFSKGRTTQKTWFSVQIHDFRSGGTYPPGARFFFGDSFFMFFSLIDFENPTRLEQTTGIWFFR